MCRSPAMRWLPRSRRRFLARCWSLAMRRLEMYGLPFLLAVLLSACAGGLSQVPVEARTDGPKREQAKPAVYRVSSGDTLYSIAWRYGLDYRMVARNNGISAPYTIHPGQQLRLVEYPTRPKAGSQAKAPVTPAGSTAGTVGTAGATAGATKVTAEANKAKVPVTSGGTTGTTAAKTAGTAKATAGGAQIKAPVAKAPATRPPVAKTTPSTAKRIPATQSSATQSSASQRPARSSSAKKPPAKKSPSKPKPTANIVWRWPTRGKVVRGFSGTTHKGIDIDGKAGDAVRATAAGQVVYAGSGLVGYGNLLIVKHNPVYLSAYGHNRKLLVEEGDQVNAGQRIAEKGSSATNSVKLHFEIRREGKPVDPNKLLPAR